jgi:hypothetical protein
MNDPTTPAQMQSPCRNQPGAGAALYVLMDTWLWSSWPAHGDDRAE